MLERALEVWEWMVQSHVDACHDAAQWQQIVEVFVRERERERERETERETEREYTRSGLLVRLVHKCKCVFVCVCVCTLAMECTQMQVYTQCMHKHT